ncbi:MAG: low specificity L-threonine aldolase [Solobacterium sp.]|nr:low specificity L-threonine aldolase [Solobacterium sp.]
MRKLYFASDYQEGMAPEILARLEETNRIPVSGYGTDEYCAAAIEKIRAVCGAPHARVHFLCGGTQTNAVVISSLLREYEGVVAADTGHIALHEAGAIEYTGHKVLTVPGDYGLLKADALAASLRSFYSDGNYEHMVFPGMVYISQPTEYGTLYSLSDLAELRKVCDSYHLPLYLDGARLGTALACRENDVSLRDLARLCDVFYIGGTKCGAIIGEAVVIRDPLKLPHFFTSIKQHGALLAKGRLAGISFDTLFTDHLYTRLGAHAMEQADQIRSALKKNGWRFYFETPTNQIFVIIANETLKELEKECVVSFWESYDESHTVIRFCTSWATRQEDTDALIRLIERFAPEL